MMRGRAALLAAAAIGGALVAPAIGGAASDPTFTAGPSPVALGGTIDLTISDCPSPDPAAAGVGIEVRFQDTFGGGVALEETSPGTWSGSIELSTNQGEDDLTLHPSCGSWEGEAVTIDVDNPKIFATPFFIPPITTPDPPEGYFGTDCPPGTTVRVAFRPGDGPDVVQTGAIDDRGDWEVPAPDFADGTPVEVRASCGSVTYPLRTYVAGGSDTATTTTATTTPTSTPAGPVPPSPATPAQPVAATPSFTG